MAAGSTSWSDLRPRIVTGVALAVVGLGAVLSGGLFLLVLVAVMAAAMIWELDQMLTPSTARQSVMLALLAGAGMFMFGTWSASIGAGVLLAVPVVGALRQSSRDRGIFLFYGLVILAGALGLFLVRNTLATAGPALWLVLIVVVTDIAGYFGGRLIGGPKFWPAVSPKKTWSGTISGWVGAAGMSALVAGLFLPGQLPLTAFVLLAMVLSLASQLGDIGESALKRRAGIKDSSNLLPGHGGVLDRFDGMIAVFALVLAIWAVLPVFDGLR